MILVTGMTGQLGYDVARELERRGEKFIGTTRKEINLLTEDGAKNFILEKKPDAVIHCAAYTAVDKAESEADLQRSRRENDLRQHGLYFWRGRAHTLRSQRRKKSRQHLRQK